MRDPLLAGSLASRASAAVDVAAAETAERLASEPANGCPCVMDVGTPCHCPRPALLRRTVEVDPCRSVHDVQICSGCGRVVRLVEFWPTLPHIEAEAAALRARRAD